MNPALPSPDDVPHGVIGRYAVFDEIAAGGMATVHLGKLVGAGGFSRVVAIKRLHAQFSKDGEFAAMFMDEARLAARIHHPNVVQTLDVVAVGSELYLVMEYVHGMSFASLLHAAKKAKQRVSPRVVAGVIAGVLEGLHAAHEATSEVGVPLGVVHRDVSPQNVLVGVEGVPRILDFGVAKAVGKLHATRQGQLKGKLAYMSPEQVRSHEVTRQSDVFSTAVVLWEALMGARLFDGENPAELILQVLSDPIPAPRSRFPDLPEALDAVVMKALSRDAAARYATARDMAVALEAAVGLAPAREIARWVEATSGDALAARRQILERIERSLAASEPASTEPRLAPDDPPHPGYERTLPQAIKPDQPFPMGDRLGPPLLPPPSPKGPTMGAVPPNRAPDERAAPLPPARSEPGEGSAGAAPQRGFAGGSPARDRDRPHRIPVRVPSVSDAHVSLRERLETPLKVVAVGAVLSGVDVLVRPLAFSASLPVRPLWVAEIVVVAGVLWALARLVRMSGA